MRRREFITLLGGAAMCPLTARAQQGERRVGVLRGIRPFNLSDAGEVERAITDFARTANGGLIVTASALSTVRRDLIIALAARQPAA
jgi:hypothetical protein